MFDSESEDEEVEIAPPTILICSPFSLNMAVPI